MENDREAKDLYIKESWVNAKEDYQVIAEEYGKAFGTLLYILLLILLSWAVIPIYSYWFVFGTPTMREDRKEQGGERMLESRCQTRREYKQESKKGGR